ncbi:MAG: hypothetical protein ACRC62_08345, partial [Microcoleus sp.]
SGDQRIVLRHKNSAGTTIRDYGNILNINSRMGYSAVVIDATAGDRINWVGSGTGATDIYWAQDHTEIKVSSFFDTGRGFVAPNLTTAFTPRTISGNGITGTVGRDGTVSTIAITGITAGSEVLQSGLSVTGGATVVLVDGGRGGAAYVDVIPNGADPVITATQTVWRRTITAVNSVGGATINVNNAASALIDATRAASISVTVPTGQQVQSVTATNAIVLSQNGNGFVELAPDNAGNIVLTVTFAIRVSNPTLSNIPINSTASTAYSPNAAGVTRTGGVSRPPATVTDFCTYNGNWDGEVELPLAARAGQVLTVRNEATLTYSLRALNTDMAGPISIPTNRSLHFVSNADGVWQWVEAPYAVRQTPQWLTAGNRGTWVTYGTISVSVTDSGNASMRLRSASGTIVVNTTTSNSWDGQVSNIGTTINTSSTFLVGSTGWTYNNIENMQETYITDRTNNRTYYVRMIVQSSHNNQRFFCYEL